MGEASTFSWDGELIRCDKHINAKECVNILEKELPTMVKLFFSMNWTDIIFKHDNVHLHTPKLTKKLFSEN